MSDDTDAKLRSLSHRLDMLFTYQLLVLGCVAFVTLAEVGSPGEGANVFLAAAAAAVVYGALSAYGPAKRFVGRQMSVLREADPRD